MTDRVFFDTNILVYAYDQHSPSKQKMAQTVIIEAIRSGDGYISSQVLGEFFNVVTKRIATPLSIDEARMAIGHLSLLNCVDIDQSLVQRAIDAHQVYQTSYWDSLIIAAAERSQCTVLLSEDFNHSQVYLGAKASNPF